MDHALPLASTNAETLNPGLILLNCEPPRPHGDLAPAIWRDEPRTLIVSGLARGGTSMLAKMLAAAGVFLGEQRDDIVFEDVELGDAMHLPDRAPLRSAIAARDARHRVWGFKRPHIHDLLRPEELTLFRRPRLILVVRDPVAVAKRNAISMYSTDRVEVLNATRAMSALTEFALAVTAPVMLVSYEKALMKPDDLVASLLAFTRLPAGPLTRAAMARAVNAEDETYRDATRLRIAGIIEGVRDGLLRGWCEILGDSRPVALELLIDGTPVCIFAANEPRADLANPGEDARPVGFTVDLDRFACDARSVVAIRLPNRDLWLARSGERIGSLTTA